MTKRTAAIPPTGTLSPHSSLQDDCLQDLEASSELADVTRYATDMAIRFFNSGVPDRPARLISDTWIYPYASPKLIPRHLKSPAQLLNYRLLKDRNSDTWGRWFQMAGGVDPNDVPVSTWRMNANLALEMALNGHGVILCSSEVTAREVAAGNLVRCFDIGFQEGGYYLVLADGASRRKAVRVFQDWILANSKALRTTPGPDNQPSG